jgi:prevent-host-death family protein
MEHRISASELARRLGDVLGRVRYRGDAFLVERHNRPIARISPVAGAARPSLRDALAAWAAAGEPDPGFADDLEQVGALDRAAGNPWDS